MQTFLEAKLLAAEKMLRLLHDMQQAQADSSQAGRRININCQSESLLGLISSPRAVKRSHLTVLRSARWCRVIKSLPLLIKCSETIYLTTNICINACLIFLSHRFFR
jgi:hypothetical protein